MQMLDDRQTKGFQPITLPWRVEKRIPYLDPRDRKLLELTLTGKLSRREAGVLVGRSAGTITRRVRRLVNRLNDPLVAALVDQGELLPERYREVGLAYFLRKRSIQQLRVDYQLSLGRVRAILRFLRGWQRAGGQAVGAHSA